MINHFIAVINTVWISISDPVRFFKIQSDSDPVLNYRIQVDHDPEAGLCSTLIYRSHPGQIYCFHSH